VVGSTYNLTSADIVVLDDNGIFMDFSGMRYILSGNTLNTSESAAYTNYGLFVIGEK
jgi:hypothetical protein